MYNIDTEVTNEVKMVSGITIIPAILEMICRTTGMGFAAVAKVTPEQWITCAVRDEIQFGLLVGGELKVDTTICHEIRQQGTGVIIDNVDDDEFYRAHHTPAMYGFKSYISIPVIRQDRRFFGTLCAIDPSPALLNTPEIIAMFKAYAQLISFHLNAVEQLDQASVKLLEEHTAVALKQQFTDLFGEAQLTGTMTGKSRKSKEFPLLIDQSNARILELLDQLQVIGGQEK